MKITASEDGPYLVEGGVKIAHQHIVTNERGESLEWRQGEAVPAGETYALCRCGHSAKQPFCDDSHASIGFKDGSTETKR